MAAPTTISEFMEIVRKSELLPPQRLEEFIHQVESARRKIGPRELAVQLIAGGFVTQFQAEQFLQGKWKGFTIGKYKVLERIGSGGMGTVYLCEHAVVGRKVAVKVLPTSQSANPTAKARFYREARASGVLNHPNLVKAHDVDEENGVHFLVMDYVDGTSLQAIVARFGPLSIARATNYISQAALGLQAAHESGLIHRDVKPANILVERNGTVRVLDLGLARFYEDNTDLLTMKYDENNVLGTADYVAPEQAVDSHDVDIRADIYSLGSTFYFLLTGQTPFPSGRISQKLVWLQVRQPTLVRSLRPEVSAELAAVVEKMMAKIPDDRFTIPAEVAEALIPWTQEPIAPPTEQEMPTLSPAALAAGNGSGTGSSPQHPRLRKSAISAPIRSGVPDSTGGQVLTLDRGPSTPAMATPLALAAQTPTTTDHPRPAVAVVPSRLLAKAANLAPSPVPVSSRTAWALRVGILVLVSAAFGVVLSWLYLSW